MANTCVLPLQLSLSCTSLHQMQPTENIAGFVATVTWLHGFCVVAPPPLTVPPLLCKLTLTGCRKTTHRSVCACVCVRAALWLKVAAASAFSELTSAQFISVQIAQCADCSKLPAVTRVGLDSARHVAKIENTSNRAVYPAQSCFNYSANYYTKQAKL